MAKRWRGRVALLGLACLAMGGLALARAGLRTGVLTPLPRRERSPAVVDREARARAWFNEHHPGEQPLNWAIAEAAAEFRRSEPMGNFVLGLTPGAWGNDCSDYVACCVDAGLGVGARFQRDSQQHLYGERRDLYESFYWRPGVQAQPGDLVRVRHSPHYRPYPEACWHIGVVGPDGQVYDFSKLKRWATARYGRMPFDAFVKHSHGHREVVLLRLRPELRFRLEPLPAPARHAAPEA